MKYIKTYKDIDIYYIDSSIDETGNLIGNYKIEFHRAGTPVRKELSGSIDTIINYIDNITY